MPYKLSPDGLSVINADTGQVEKKHPTKAKAKAHLLALRMNVKEAGRDDAKKTGAGKPKPKAGGGKYPAPPRKKMEALRRYLEAGARHSGKDTAMLQTIHDHAVELGAACSSKTAEATSYDVIRDKIRSKLDDTTPPGQMYGPWIAELFDEYVIAELDNQEYWQIPYTTMGDEIELSSRDKWLKVERQQTWVKASEVLKNAQRA